MFILSHQNIKSMEGKQCLLSDTWYEIVRYQMFYVRNGKTFSSFESIFYMNQNVSAHEPRWKTNDILFSFFWTGEYNFDRDKFMTMACNKASVFECLRPVCVQLTREHTRNNVAAMSKILLSVDRTHLQDLQEYVLFPLRIILKNETK